MPKLGELDFVFHGNADAKDAFLIMHGYGADMHDLAPIGEWMHGQVGGAWYFIQAPLEVAIGPYMSGRAWFPIDMMKLQMATMQGDFASLFENDLPSGIDEAASKVKGVLEFLKNRHTNVHIGGFSQGSMMAAKVALENQSKIASLTMLSGVLVSRKIWEDLVPNALAFPTFQSHGSLDPVLPVKEGHKLKEFLSAHNSNHQYVEFRGGHEIPMPVLSSWREFLQKVMS